jgi:transposase
MQKSEATCRRGGITKAGNALARRVLIEGTWTYPHDGTDQPQAFTTRLE